MSYALAGSFNKESVVYCMLLLLPPLPEVIVACLKASVAPVTQRRQSGNRDDEGIEYQSSSGVYLP